MSISPIAGAAPIAPPEAVEPKETPVRNDHDGDDGAPVKAALQKGQGTIVDQTA